LAVRSVRTPAVTQQRGLPFSKGHATPGASRAPWDDADRARTRLTDS